MNIIRSVVVDPASDTFWSQDTSALEGKAIKPLLVLVNRYETGSTAESQLTKMLGAGGLKEAQYNIIQLGTDQKMAWHLLREQLDPKVIFLVGITPAQLGISSMFQLNVPNSFSDRMWLPTLSLATLEQNADIKKQLWASGMKPLFVDKAYGNLLG